MSHECHKGSCSHENHSHHSHLASSCNCCCCKDPKCQCECHHRHQCKYSDELLALADEAWMDLIKEKIKAEISKNSGEHIERIAQLVAKANHERWTYKMDEKESHNTYEDDLNNLIYRKK